MIEPMGDRPPAPDGDAARVVAPAAPPGLQPGPAPSFSVIIAAYQAAATIEEAVRSALEQTKPPLEVIVCDDGSTDGTADALASLRDDIVLLRKPNGGAASARNDALRAASGDFVVPLDADDAFLPGRLEALARLASERPDLDLLATDALFDVEGEVVGRFYDENRFVVDDQRAGILESCFVGWPAARRERLLRIGGFDEMLPIAYDWDAWLRMIFDGARAGLIAEPHLRYRLRAGSLSADRARALRERVTMLDKVSRSGRLSPAERSALAAARRGGTERAAAAELRAAVSGGPGARRRAAALARARAVPLRTRCLAAAAAAAPALAARVLAARPLSESPLHARRGGS
jgi:hypothetical protein